MIKMIRQDLPTKKISMSARKISNPYAEALLRVGIEFVIKNDEPDIFFQILFDMQELIGILELCPELEKFLTNPFISKTIKKIVLDNCFNQRFNANTLDFLKLLIDKKRIQYLIPICYLFAEKCSEYLCFKDVEVISVVPLTENQKDLIINKIVKFFGPVFSFPYVQPAHINLKMKIDSTILAGLVIKIRSQVINLSLLEEIKRLGKSLNVVI